MWKLTKLALKLFLLAVVSVYLAELLVQKNQLLSMTLFFLLFFPITIFASKLKEFWVGVTLAFTMGTVNTVALLVTRTYSAEDAIAQAIEPHWVSLAIFLSGISAHLLMFTLLRWITKSIAQSSETSLKFMRDLLRRPPM